MKIESKLESSGESPLQEERRNTQRRQLIYYLRAWDTNNSHLLGHIVDFTSNGLMLISEEPIQIGSEYAMEVRLPDPQGAIRPVSFRAVCRWSSGNTAKSLFDSGFEMVEETTEGIGSLHSVTHDYGFGI